MIDVFIIFALLGSAYYYADPVWAIAAALYNFACAYEYKGSDSK